MEIPELCLKIFDSRRWRSKVAAFHASASIIRVFGIYFAGFASSSDHFVGKLQFLQPPDFGPLPVTPGRSTRSLLVAQEVHRQRQR